MVSGSYSNPLRQMRKLEEALASTKDADNKFIESSLTSVMSLDSMNEVSTLDTCMDTIIEGTYENVHICEDDDTLVIEPQGDLDKNRIQDHEPEDFWSHPKDDKILDINTAMTAGTVAIGIGYAQLEEQMAAVNIPCMSQKTYIKHRELVLDEFEKTALENMKEAGEIEKQLALESDEIINGIPYITVVADGCWAKRSYGTNYDSLSGVGAIIGYRTRKVLFVGIRNKFCTVCDMAERKSIKARVHKCYKNFDRNESSTRMESDAIVEGFKKAAAQRMQEKQPESYKIKELQKDLFNIPSHIFGEHKECKERDTCQNPQGQIGTCINIKSCTLLLNLLKSNPQNPQVGNFLRASVCRYEGSDPWVCCPSSINGGNAGHTDNGLDADRGQKGMTNTEYGPLSPPNCGFSNVTLRRIVGGEPASLGAWPWITALGYRNSRNPNVPKWLCGGVLISSRHVLTAGHCVYGREDLYKVRIGDLDLNDDYDGATPFEDFIERKTVHPEYNPRTYTNDVAVLKTSQEVPFTLSVHPICLPVDDIIRNRNLENTYPFVVGWGSVYFHEPASSKLLQTQIPVRTQEECSNAFRNFATTVIDNRVLCAGFARGGKDACQVRERKYLLKL
ncbi:PREDICTED: venom prothrombin activator nigrarin-D-like [Wasmannia auropunctata]|uniref:venom prothrombin activator nigrarin-D-like n=1 Tax=Wasmannia auropunctata TaxID=64793 RepID=UPI0005ED5E8F|nr:PREDICTED: venom prothrombin activator nigrarin-D-like [Wasmannia auropunctata]